MPPSVRSTFTVILAAAFSAAASASGGGRAAFEDRQRAIADGLAEAFEEFGAAPGVDAVGQPGDLAVAGGLQETLDRRQRFDPLDRIGFWRELAQRDARGAAPASA